ncbi:helicase [Alkalihalophilus marmarensis DSM 21297]|uniref:Helicase n=1 Tax=Alkalihalophilus marmarensis DSM 21297 TaxID=1188261 RepID=U6SK74_9BACI|nr:DEAD/DEAH box helicase family protein [Alkalihalophilus marmarensis]ERN51978.1 helicase [Alkalihalophilus marmarensis DSM 21297]
MYCRHCIKLGKVQECKPLIHLATSDKTPFLNHSSSLKWKGELSLAQEKASNSVIKAVEEKSSLLLWAVCGAGKTEMLFKGIEVAINKGERVLIATPRVDVVKELSPRFRAVFPSIPIASLYGGSKDQHINAQLVIATTHQVMRYYQCFDVVVVDEVDAFPFSYDKSLQYAIQQVRKPQSSLIYLTATPASQIRNIPNLEIVYVPRRYHGFSLPVPSFTWCGNWRTRLKKKKLPPVVMKWLQERLEAKKPTLLFLPSVEVLKEISRVLVLQSITHEAVYAADKERHEKVKRFRNEEYTLLLTTTILERGITIANLDVAVLGAEDHVFTESALVQIAGRVGRSAKMPTGDVTFFHYGKTDAMVRARAQINWMNKREV